MLEGCFYPATNAVGFITTLLIGYLVGKLLEILCRNCENKQEIPTHKE